MEAAVKLELMPRPKKRRGKASTASELPNLPLSLPPGIAPGFSIEAQANRIKWLIDNSGLSNVEVARRIGFDAGGLSRMANGERRVTQDVCCKLAKFFGITTDYIYFGDRNGLTLANLKWLDSAA